MTQTLALLFGALILGDVVVGFERRDRGAARVALQ